MYRLTEFISVSIVCSVLIPRLTECGGTLELTMFSFLNPTNEKWSGSCCDPLCWSDCDDVFQFGLDSIQGSQSDPTSDSILSKVTGTFDNSKNNYFSTNGYMKGVFNPITQYFTSWPGSVLFKCNIMDDDSPLSSDHVDGIIQVLTVTPGLPAQQIHMLGMRPQDKTTLTMTYRVYCDNDYYGSSCSVYCVAHDDDANGHYTCDPSTGNIVCRSGYENTTNICKTSSDHCKGNNYCLNGATCVNLAVGFTCSCVRGYTGKSCETDINDCNNNPCQNGGTCRDLVADFSCQCISPYVGKICSLQVCQTASPCKNGGTCYGDGKCICPAGYYGDCSFTLCDAVTTCRNGGTCSNGACVCPPGTAGLTCEVYLCDVVAGHCLNGASCINGTCACPNGFSGRNCETNLLCANNPCQHNGACRVEVQGNGTVFKCSCLPGYSGNNCSEVAPGSSPFNSSADPQLSIPSSSESSTIQNEIGKIALAFIIISGIFLLIIIALSIYICISCQRQRRSRKPLESSGTSSLEAATPVQVENDYEVKFLKENSQNNLAHQISPSVQENVYDKPHESAISPYSELQKVIQEKIDNTIEEDKGLYEKVDDKDVTTTVPKGPVPPPKRSASCEEKVQTPC